MVRRRIKEVSCNIIAIKGRYTQDVHENCPNFKTPHPPCLAVINSSTPMTLDAQFQTNSPPLHMITNQLKENTILGWLLYVFRPFLQVGFRFQYQFNINLVWLSINFSLFSWSQSRPQSNFKKSRIYFSPSSYSEKTRWGQGWAEASLSTFSWLYILVCTIVKKIKKCFLY